MKTLGVATVADQLTRVRERIPEYQAELSGKAKVAQAFQAAGERIREAWYASNPDADDALRREIEETLTPMRRALDSPVLVDAYDALVPCVEAFVATELDTETPGQRGLGRSTDESPRLGGAFREQLVTPAARREYGPLIEQMVFETYAGTAAALQTFYKEPTPPKVRPANEVFELWVPRIYVGTQGLGDNTMSVITAAHADTEKAIMDAAERHGLLSGFRRSKRERTLVASASFWVAAGASLYWVPAQR